MVTYLVRRLLQSLLFMAIASLAVYTFLVYVMPDGPNAGYNTNPYTPAFFVSLGNKDEIVRNFKVDRPWPLSFLTWLFDPSATTTLNGNFEPVPAGIDITIGDLRIRGSGILTGNFGTSRLRLAIGGPGRSVSANEWIGSRWGNTLSLVGAALLIALLVAVPLGVVQAITRRSAFDHFSTFFSLVGMSVPMFVLGLGLIIFLAVLPARWREEYGWTWLPHLASGGVGSQGEASPLTDKLYHLVLPSCTLAIPQIAVLSRFLKFSMLDVFGEDYIRTALAIGVPRLRLVLRHALRNAMIPAITVFSLILPAVASGSILVESIFDYPGMGQLYFKAIGGCVASISLLQTDNPPCPPIGPIDYSLTLIFTIMLIGVTALSTLLADMLYVAADPRINLRQGVRR